MKKMLLMCIVLAMLFGVTTVRADMASSFATGDVPEPWKEKVEETGFWFYGGGHDSPSISANFTIQNGEALFQLGELTAYTLHGQATLGVDVSTATLTYIAFKESLTFAFQNPLVLTSFVYGLGSQGNGNLEDLSLSYVLASPNGDEVSYDNVSTLDSAGNKTSVFFGVFADEGMFIKSITLSLTTKGEIQFRDPEGIVGVSGPGEPDGPNISGGETPEPTTLLILGLGTMGAGFAARRRARRQ